jgi:hypothetical protein
MGKFIRLLTAATGRVRLARSFRGNTIAAGMGWRIGAIFAAAGASILVILGIAQFYGYVGTNVVGDWTYGPLIIFGVLLGVVAIALEVVGRER